MRRPSFAAAWAAPMRIYSPSQPGEKVASVVGGAVAKNIHMPSPYGWENTCAVRMSYILNQCGLLIPSSGQDTVTGADGKNYFFRVPRLIKFLTQQWGKPNMVLPYPPKGEASLKEKKGLSCLKYLDGGTQKAMPPSGMGTSATTIVTSMSPASIIGQTVQTSGVCRDSK